MAEAATHTDTPDAESPANHTGRYRIAHLSDLHFGAHFDAGLWRYLREVLREHQPQLLAITGDLVDSPSLFQLGLVRRELAEIARRLGCDYLLVPGNHDVAIAGNVALWPWNGKFRIVFGGGHGRHFERMPTYSEYREMSRPKRWRFRLGYTLKFAFLRLAGQLRDPGEGALPVLVGDRSDGRAIFARFNSNERLWLATGRVDHDVIQTLERDIESLGRNGDPGWLAPRIALAHHHAIAIPYSTTNESLTAFEPFLTMRNAGTLLHELGKLDFDILLHGHKHFWNFARLSFDAPGREAAEMAVIAAGSATVTQTRAGSNSINLIDLMPNGMIEHRPLFYGEGLTIAGGYVEKPPVTRALLTLEQVKERAHRKAVKRLQCLSETLERDFRVGADGCADLVMRVRGYRTFGARRTRKASFHVGVTTGAISPSSIRPDVMAGICDYTIHPDHPKTATPRKTIEVNLGTDVCEGRENSVDFGIRLRTVNNHAITAWEAGMLNGPCRTDWVGVVIRQPARRLRLKLELPPGLTDTDPEVVCERPAHYPLLRFNQEGEVLLPAGETDWVIDPDFTRLERHRLTIRRTAAGCACELEVEEPLVGYRYLVRWLVSEKEEEAIAPTERGRAMQFRQNLLRMGLPDPPGYLQRLGNTSQRWLGVLLKGGIQPLFRSAGMPDERLLCSLWVYDDGKDARALRLLIEVGAAGGASAKCRVIPLNEGVTGAAFKKRAPSLFVQPGIAGQAHDGAYIYHDQDAHPGDGPDYTALAALPLYLGRYEDRAPPPEAMIGVIAIASNARDSGLLKLLPGCPESRRLWSALAVLGDRFIDQLAATALEETRGHADNPAVPEAR